MSQPARTAQASPQRASDRNDSATRRSETSRPTPPRAAAPPARPGRASVRRPSSVLMTSTDGLGALLDQDKLAEQTVLVENLKKSLREAERTASEYQRNFEIAKKQIDDLNKHHLRLEEQMVESRERLDLADTKEKQFTRQLKDLKQQHQIERESMAQEQEESKRKETELSGQVQRLKETIAGHQMRFNTIPSTERRSSRQGRSDSIHSIRDENDFAPRAASQRRGSSLIRSDKTPMERILAQRDATIETLKLELAEASIRAIELENRDDNNLNDLERALVETRVHNAKLKEENESFQYLLSEKTLNGDLFHPANLDDGGDGIHTPEKKLETLAEELENAESSREIIRRLELDNKTLRDHNKALTLYVDKIITRVLQDDNYTHSLEQDNPMRAATVTHLPPANSSNSGQPALNTGTSSEDTPQSFLQRATSSMSPSKLGGNFSSIFKTVSSHEGGESTHHTASGGNNNANASPKKADKSEVGPRGSVNEDLSLAPSIPLNRTASTTAARQRGHRRLNSDTSTSASTSNNNSSAATIVNQMYRATSGSVSPTTTGPPRNSYLSSVLLPGSAANNNAMLPPSQFRNSIARSSLPSNDRSVSDGSIVNHESQSVKAGGSSINLTTPSSTTTTSSPPRHASGSGQAIPGAVMAQSKLRPLRLVQDQEAERRTGRDDDATAAAKRQNRASWLPSAWFAKKDEAVEP